MTGNINQHVLGSRQGLNGSFLGMLNKSESSHECRRRSFVAGFEETTNGIFGHVWVRQGSFKLSFTSRHMCKYCTYDWKIMGNTPGLWQGIQQDSQSYMVVRRCPVCAGPVWSREGGCKRMWVTATAPTSSHNETTF